MGKYSVVHYSTTKNTNFLSLGKKSKFLFCTFFYTKTIEHLYYSRKKLFLIIYCCLIFVDVMDDIDDYNIIIVRFQSQFPESIVILPWKNNICHILQDKWVMLYIFLSLQ